VASPSGSLGFINADEVVVDDRIRSDMGEIDALTNSIKEFGLIQPIVLGEDSTNMMRLIAGGRRFTALKRLGITRLEHGVHWVFRDENNRSEAGKLRLQAIEIEENIRRKDLTWQEQVLGKQMLLETMQKIHGESIVGRPTRAESRTGETQGFGVRKLAAMLGESPATTSQDLQLARAMQNMPKLNLANSDTKGSAFRKLGIVGAVVSMQKAASVQRANTSAADAADPNSTQNLWSLYEGDFKSNVSRIESESVDLVYTDLPFGVGLSEMSKHGASGVVAYQDDRESIVGDLDALAEGAYRVLRNDRYGVFFFGFNYYTELVGALERAGFKVNRVPFVWFKNTRSTENPNVRYANSYDPAIIVMKGSPVFIRPGQQNFANIMPVFSKDRLQIAQQPTELVTKFLSDMTVPGATVLDFFGGSGTTGEAAIRGKRRVILFEREPSACAVIKARLGAIK
jgi:DNA modification methylase